MSGPIVLGPFSGEAPRVGKTQLPVAAAQIAQNCDLGSGELAPLKSYLPSVTLAKSGNLDTLYRFGYGTATDRWCHWSEDVDVVKGLIADDTTERTYFTGTDVPRVFDNTLVDVGGNDQYPESSYKLAVPQPSTAPTAAIGVNGSGASRTVSWVYTYVRKWPSGKVDEGKPSNPSNDLTYLNGGATINLTTIAAPPTGHGITHVWVYRLKTGTTAEYHFLKEIGAGSTSTTDTTDDANLSADVLVSQDWDAPPDGLKGLIALNNGSMAGFSGNQLCLSVPYQNHAWPQAYRYAVSGTIVAIGGDGTFIVVATDGLLHVADGSDPSAVIVRNTQEFWPCVSKRALKVVPEVGVLFPVKQGICRVNLNGASLITEPLLTRHEWDDFYPSTLHAAVLDSRYILFYETGTEAGEVVGGGLIFDFTSTGTGMRRIGFYAHAMTLAADGNLYMIVRDNSQNYVAQWEGSTGNLSFRWKSKAFLAREETYFSAGMVLAEFLDAATVAAYLAEKAAADAADAAVIAGGNLGGEIADESISYYAIAGDDLSRYIDPYAAGYGILLKMYADDVEQFSDTIYDQNPFRLGDGYLGKMIEIELQGSLRIRQVRLAQGVTELSS